MKKAFIPAFQSLFLSFSLINSCISTDTCLCAYYCYVRSMLLFCRFQTAAKREEKTRNEQQQGKRNLDEKTHGPSDGVLKKRYLNNASKSIM